MTLSEMKSRLDELGGEISKLKETRGELLEQQGKSHDMLKRQFQEIGLEIADCLARGDIDSARNLQGQMSDMATDESQTGGRITACDLGIEARAKEQTSLQDQFNSARKLKIKSDLAKDIARLEKEFLDATVQIIAHRWVADKIRPDPRSFMTAMQSRNQDTFRLRIPQAKQEILDKLGLPA